MLLGAGLLSHGMQAPYRCSMVCTWELRHTCASMNFPAAYVLAYHVHLLVQALVHTQAAINAVPGMLVGVFLLYVVGGFWRSELSKVFEHARQCRNFAELIANNAGGGGSGGRRKK